MSSKNSFNTTFCEKSNDMVSFTCNFQKEKIFKSENKSSRHVWPVTYQNYFIFISLSEVRQPILGICALYLTHPSAHTQQWTHTWSSGPPGEQLGVRCLAQGSHLSRDIEGGESTGCPLPPLTIPAGPETLTHDLWVTSPTLYPSTTAHSQLSNFSQQYPINK